MLRLILNGSNGPIGSLEIANERSAGALCNYAAVLYNAADSPVSMAMVEGYARWSAPAHDLALRALAMALCDSEASPRWECVRVYRPAPCAILATLWIAPPLSSPRRLGSWYVPVRGAAEGTEQIEDAAKSSFALPSIDPRESAWAILARVWCHRLAAGSEMPSRRPPVVVPLHRRGDLGYVRLSEMPEHIRSAFERRHRNSTCPVVHDAPDAYYAWDLSGFLGYEPWAQVETTA